MDKIIFKSERGRLVRQTSEAKFEELGWRHQVTSLVTDFMVIDDKEVYFTGD